MRRHVQALLVDPDMSVEVERGDTLYRIAREHEVRRGEIRWGEGWFFERWHEIGKRCGEKMRWNEKNERR